jgi:hypothetical protein
MPHRSSVCSPYRPGVQHSERSRRMRVRLRSFPHIVLLGFGIGLAIDMTVLYFAVSGLNGLADWRALGS